MRGLMVLGVLLMACGEEPSGHPLCEPPPFVCSVDLPVYRWDCNPAQGIRQLVWTGGNSPSADCELEVQFCYPGGAEAATRDKVVVGDGAGRARLWASNGHLRSYSEPHPEGRLIYLCCTDGAFLGKVVREDVPGAWWGDLPTLKAYTCPPLELGPEPVTVGRGETPGI